MRGGAGHRPTHCIYICNKHRHGPTPTIRRYFVVRIKVGPQEPSESVQSLTPPKSEPPPPEPNLAHPAVDSIRRRCIENLSLTHTHTHTPPEPPPRHSKKSPIPWHEKNQHHIISHHLRASHSARERSWRSLVSPPTQGRLSGRLLCVSMCKRAMRHTIAAAKPAAAAAAAAA
jgi:hypothetical protein